MIRVDENEFLEWVNRIPEPERVKLSPDALATFFVVKKILESKSVLIDVDGDVEVWEDDEA